MNRVNQWIAKTPTGMYIVIDMTSLDRKDKCMIMTNCFDYHAKLNRELDWDIFGTKPELEVRLREFTERHGLEMFWLNNRGERGARWQEEVASHVLVVGK